MSNWSEMGGLEKVARVICAAAAVAAAIRSLREKDIYGAVGCAALAFLALGAEGEEIRAIVSKLES